MATLAQMKARALSGHYHALSRIAEGRPALPPTARPGEIRGMKVVLKTLRRWGAIDPDGQITDIGRQLLSERP